jgi:hypothetical protein
LCKKFENAVSFLIGNGMWNSKQELVSLNIFWCSGEAQEAPMDSSILFTKSSASLNYQAGSLQIRWVGLRSEGAGRESATGRKVWRMVHRRGFHSQAQVSEFGCGTLSLVTH